MSSGKFILRLPPTLHDRLRTRASQAGVSLNELCKQILLQAIDSKQESNQLVKQLLDLNVPINAIYLFGSAARGEEKDTSDTDLLIIVDRSHPIDRSLYHLWDSNIATSKETRKLSPHFVHLADSIASASGLWFEVAMEGNLLWERDPACSRFLTLIRHAISTGELKRKFSHGHPYWIKDFPDAK